MLFPYLLRRNRMSVWLGSVKISAGTPYLKRMWPHYWLGYLLLLLSVIHTVVPIQARQLRGLNALGLWLAAGGLLFSMAQSAIRWWRQNLSLIRRVALGIVQLWMVTGV